MNVRNPIKKVSQEEREIKNLQKGLLIWMTGLSGAGKTTLAYHLERALFDLGQLVYVLDGDNIRSGLNSDLGFSADERFENIRRIGEVTRLFVDAGMVVIAAFISPYRKDRDLVRTSMASGYFVEIFIDSPLDVCEKRDVKGLYKKARTGLIQEFTGISSPYEAPLNPEVHLKTNIESVNDCILKILDYLKIAR
jgi:adenylylsulfate kinase